MLDLDEIAENTEAIRQFIKNITDVYVDKKECFVSYETDNPKVSFSGTQEIYFKTGQNTEYDCVRLIDVDSAEYYTEFCANFQHFEYKDNCLVIMGNGIGDKKFNNYCIKIFRSAEISVGDAMSFEEIIDKYYEQLKNNGTKVELEKIKKEIDDLRYSETNKELFSNDKLKIWEGLKKRFVFEINISQQDDRSQESLNFSIQKTDNSALLSMIDEIENNIKKEKNGNS